MRQKALSAIEENSLEALEALVEHGLDVNSADSGQTLLSFAVKTRNLSAVQWLIHHGAYPQALENLALKTAVSSKAFQIAEYLLKFYTDLEFGRLLYDSIAEGDQRLVRFLVSYGLRKNLPIDSQEATEAAVENGHASLVDFLVGAFVSTELPEEDQLERINPDADDLLEAAVEEGDLEAVLEAVQAGANIHLDNEYPLRLAVEEGYLEIVEYLILEGADVRKAAEALELIDALEELSDTELEKLLLEHASEA